MTGKEIFDRYQSIALMKGLGSQEFFYGNILYEALRIEGEKKLFELLEVAESTGQRVSLSYSTASADDQNEPALAVLI
ncbi:hypothetical protein [Dyadobacter aurulentus]|uniref:hypothetical protein n=1 Tax=Dyadobacter sp. UC 10 TaxID=2605428 RepID=UPI001CEC0FF6|nr:hypothetical protein [Dyadobacter sp. UC 10]